MATRVATLLQLLLGRFLPDFKAAPKGGFLRFSVALNRDRGEPRGSAPPTPPYIRVRIRRFVGLLDRLDVDRGEAEAFEEGIRESRSECRADTDPPRAVRAPGGLCRQILSDTKTAQFREAVTPILPLLPDDGTEPSPDPFVQPTQDPWCLAEAEVPAPPIQVA